MARTIAILGVAALGCALAAQTTPSRSKTRGKAKSAASAATRLSPELEQAEAAIQRKDYAAAEKLLLTATKNNLQDFRAFYDLGFVYAQTKRSQEAISALQRSIAIDAKIDQSQALLGTILLAENRHAEAIPPLTKAAELKPTAQAWMTLAEAQQPTDGAAALASLAKAVALAPSDPEPHLRAGQLHEQMKAWALAEREYLAAQKLSPSASAWAGLASVYQQTGREPEAIQALREYIKLAPGDLRAELQLARALRRSGRNEEALTALHAMGQPTDASLVEPLAAEYLAQKKYSEAAKLYRELTQRSPQNADAQYRFGLSLIGSGDFQEAEKRIIRALELDPGLAPAYGDLAVAASKNGNHMLAIKALDARAKFQPDDAGAYFMRATSYDHLKQYPQAAENYRKFLAAAAGRYPDQEWQARHRLIALEPEGKKQK